MLTYLFRKGKDCWAAGVPDEKGGGMLDNIKYCSSFGEEESKLLNVTPGIELGSVCKTGDSQIIVKYKKIFSNSCSYAEIADTKFFIFRDE